MTNDEGASSFELRRKKRIDDEYNELRMLDPDLFRECVQAAEGIAINHYKAFAALDAPQSLKLVSDIEAALVSLTLKGCRGDY